MSAFVEAAGHRLEYRWIEPPRPVAAANRPVLVFLHEGLGSVALWKRFPARVAEHTGCRALVYSRYGYGRSDRLAAPRGADYMHREALDVLPELLERLGVDAPVLIGHSDGASIALIYAGTEGRRTRGLVLLAPHVFVEELTVRSIAQARVAFETTDLAQRLGRYHDDAHATFRGWNDIWLHPDFRNWNIERCLPSIRAPLLLIQGRDDQYGTLAQLDAIARQVSGPVETLVLDDCAHSPHVDQPEATLSAIAGFVGKYVDRSQTLDVRTRRTQSSRSEDQ
ncbi:MAG TPA: alpha/beta hydrolase [Burkholderiales bacterium]|nr:alpha/beta hydrolase [Burkholderiales bacterium]